MYLNLLYYVKCYVYKMSGRSVSRSVSVYTDTSASHEYLCLMIQNGHEFVNYLSKTSNNHVFKLKINVKNFDCDKRLCKSGPFCISVYRH